MKATLPSAAASQKSRGKPTDLTPDAVAQGSDADAPLPHERDESTHSTDPEPVPVMRRAYEDLEAGMVDTDMHGTPGLDAERKKELLRRER